MARSLPPLSLRIRAELFVQLGVMETAGLPAEKAFGLLKLDAAAQPRAASARVMITRGMDVALAGEKSGLFNPLETTLVRAALGAGSPARTYRRLGELYGARAMQLAKLKSRLWLPGFMMLVAVLTGPLPGLFTGKLGIGGYLWQVLRPLLVVGVIAWVIRSLPAWTRDGNDLLDNLLPRVPLFGRMHVRRNARDFFESLALLLEAGVPMLEALPKAEATVENRRLRIEFERILPMVEHGATLAQALATLPALGGDRATAFAQTGEASGTLPEMLFRHTDMETAAIDNFAAQVAAWAPRVVYALVAIWIAAGLLKGPGIMTKVPDNI